MKKLKSTILSILVILLSITFNSCGSESHKDIEEKVKTSSLLGKWYLFDYYWENDRECETKSFIQFNKDGTFRRVDYFNISGLGCILEHDDTGTYTFDAVNNKIYTYYYRGEVEGELSTDIYVNVRLTSETFYSDYDEGGEGNVDDWNVGYKK